MPDFIIIGNVARDLTPDGWRAGGTPVYAAAVALGLGWSVGVVTAAEADVVAAGLPPQVDVVRAPVTQCTTFENIYDHGRRTQYLRAPGSHIPDDLMPRSWENGRVHLVGPVYHEVRAALVRRCRGIVGVCGQGYLRATTAEQRVVPLPPATWEAAAVLAGVRALFVSTEDTGPNVGEQLAAWSKLVPLLVLTDGRNGSRIATGPDIWLFLLIAGTGAAGQLLTTEAFRLAEASLLAPLQYLSLLWAVLFGYVFFGDVPTLTLWAGAAIIVAAAVYVVRDEARQHRKRP